VKPNSNKLQGHKKKGRVLDALQVQIRTLAAIMFQNLPVRYRELSQNIQAMIKLRQNMLSFNTGPKWQCALVLTLANAAEALFSSIQ